MADNHQHGAGKRVVSVLDGFVDALVLIGLLFLLFVGIYALWDSNTVYEQADSANYQMYKPSRVETVPSYGDLVAMNPDVFGWLTVYGTNIDYPLVQADDNEKYLTTNAMGEYSLSGSLFLEHRNSKDFSDFASVIYGHHMDKNTMFGEIGNFLDKDYFDAREYGNIYYDGENHGIMFFAAIPVSDAYTCPFYAVPVSSDNRQGYLDEILREATQQRNVSVNVDDHIILLSTCSSSTTNGRTILVGKITDETYDNPFPAEGGNSGTGLASGNSWCNFLITWWWLWALLLALLLATIIYRIYMRNKRRKGEKRS